MDSLKRVGVRRAELSHTLEELAPAGSANTLLRDQIIGALRRAIELGTLRAGDRLVEKDLCLTFGVSRPSLREALRDLEASGAVTKISARTLVITALSREEALSIVDVRTAIESLLAEQFIARATEEDIDALGAALRRLRATSPVSPGSLDASREYHEIWCRAAGNRFAFTLLMNIQLRLAVLRAKGFRSPTIRARNFEYQAAVFDCMMRRKVKEARAMVERHNRDIILMLIESARVKTAG